MALHPNPRILDITHLDNGLTRITYDVAVDKRATIVVPTAQLQEFLAQSNEDVWDAIATGRTRPQTAGK